MQRGVPTVKVRRHNKSPCRSKSVECVAGILEIYHTIFDEVCGVCGFEDDYTFHMVSCKVSRPTFAEEPLFRTTRCTRQCNVSTSRQPNALSSTCEFDDHSKPDKFQINLQDFYDLLQRSEFFRKLMTRSKSSSASCCAS